ncbi:MAG: hypothetical protein R3B74_18035 [Nitrospirales bacterium]|nr:hypothetical protein [Nitrospirales bacterium]
MDVKTFRSRMIKLSAFMFIIIAGFPFILYGLVRMTSCGGGACGALAAGAGMILRPLALVIFVIGVGKAVYKRCKHARLSWGWSLMALLWMIGSSSYLLGAQNFWGANFGMGLIAIRQPLLLLFLAAFTIFLGFYNGREKDDGSETDLKVAWAFAGFSTGVGIFVNFPAVKEPFISLLLLFGIFPLKDIVAFNKTVHTFINLPPIFHTFLSWIAPAIFVLALLYIYTRSRQNLMPEAAAVGFQK